MTATVAPAPQGGGGTGCAADRPLDGRRGCLLSQKYLLDRPAGSTTYLRHVALALRSAGLALDYLALKGAPALFPARQPAFGLESVRARGARRLGPVNLRPGELRKALLRHRSASDEGSPATAPQWSLRTPDARERDFLQTRLAVRPPEVVIANYFTMAAAFDLPAARRAVKVVLTHDVFGRRREAFRRFGLRADLPDELIDGELLFLRQADIVVAIQENDRRWLQERLPAARVVCLSYWPEPRFCRSEPAAPECLFVGADSFVNRHGLAWLLERVWPMVRAAVPSARLRLCGPLVAEGLPAVDGVEFAGVVPSLAVAYERAAVAVVPLLIGSGLKIKTMEALAFGRPVVTTPEGAEGLPQGLLQQLQPLDDPAALAGRLVRLLSDRDERRRTEARQREAFVAAGPAAAGATELCAAIDGLLANRRI